MARPNIVTRVRDLLRDGKQIRMVADQYRTPTSVYDLAEASLRLAENRVPGIFHVSGHEMVSVYDFSRVIASHFGLDPDLISPVLTSELNEKAVRPLKTGFIINKAAMAIGYAPKSLYEGLQQTFPV